MFAAAGAMAQPDGLSGRSLPEPTRTNTLTLERAIQLGLEHNPGLAASRARVEAAVGRAEQASKWSNPELELTAAEWPVGGGGGFSDAIQTIGMAQTLPFPGKKSLDRQVGRAGVNFTSAGVSARRTELVREIKAAFCQALVAERFVAVSRELVQVAESSASTARKRVEAGAAPYQEQLRAEIQLEEARTELAGFQREQETSRRLLFASMGYPDLGAPALEDRLAETADKRLSEPEEVARLEAHPLLKAAGANLARAELENRRAALEPYPDLKAGVAGGWLGETDQSIIELRFSLPLPLLNRSKGLKKETSASVKAAEAELIATRQQLQTQFARARNNYLSSSRQVASYREQILPKAAEALRLVQRGFEEGKFTFLDLLDTQRTAAQARLTYQQKLLDFNVAQADLQALLEPLPDVPTQKP